MENEKKRDYGDRFNEVEHSSFTPIVFSTCDGMGREATVVVKKLADAIATKSNESYSRVRWLDVVLFSFHTGKVSYPLHTWI